MLAITGATGFIGSYLSDVLKHPQKRLSRKNNSIPNPPHHWITGDLTHPTDISHFIIDSPVLIHLACTTHPRSSNLDIKNDLDDNLVTSVNLFEAYAKANPDGHIVFSSSGGNMYQAASSANLHSETEQPLPQSSYGIHKLASENYLRLICDLYGIRGTVLRISNPYGVLLSKERVQGLIGVAFAKIMANEPLQIFDSLDSVRDYIHLSDVAAAFELVIANPPKKKECRLFNVSSGQGHSLSEMLRHLEQVTGQSLAKQFSTTPLPAPSYSVLSNQKMKDELGWKPDCHLKAGLEQMWQNIQNSQLAHQI